ncbi:dihydroxy-acid dehydratase [Spirillospora sp. NPDC048819]|uniref:dihydroxy-acid dehydratase n=1 Tax=Spirillospora sp. NPDC048819 TaxID=3155268 RepID=UPI0033EA9189
MTGGEQGPASTRLDGGAGGMVLRSWLHAEGFGASASARPVIGICTSWSELNPCNAGLRDVGAAVKRGVLRAGGLPLEFPTISLGENFLTPTAMLLRNLMAMDVEEMTARSPVDGVVLLGGCDKTLPAQLMGVASAGKPALVVPAGPRLESRFRGRPLVTDDYWDLAAQRVAGRLPAAEWACLETCLNISPGTCNVMGTATTMAVVAEALGMSLPGAALIPAVDGRRFQLAEATGAVAVAAVEAGLTPEKIMTRGALGNALRAVLAVGGSTNAVIHLTAVAGRLGLRLGLDDVAELAMTTPQLAAIRPSGPHLLSDFAEAGGVPALLRALEPLLDTGATTVTGESLAKVIAAAPEPDGAVIHPVDAPLRPDGGLTVLRGSLAPRGALIKNSAAEPRLWRHTGPALVFDGRADMQARIHDRNLPVTPDTVLVLRGAGPRGGPGMPEAGGIPVPSKLFEVGVTDMVRVSDARMSGTQGGAVVLHVTPEAAVGGPLALVRDGDLVRLDVRAGTLDLLVDAAELDRRGTCWQAPAPAARRGYEALYTRHVLQADEGCDFDFLRHPDAAPHEEESPCPVSTTSASPSRTSTSQSSSTATSSA